MARKKATETEPASQNMHISQLPFSEMLAHFASGGIGDMSSSAGMSADMKMSFSGGKSAKEKKETPRRSTNVYLDDDEEDEFGEMMEDLSEPITRESIRKEREARQLEDDAMDALMDDFDELIEGAFESDENVAFRNSLVTMGRKYAIEGMQHSGESSEVSRAFAKQEQMIYDLIDEEIKAGLSIQKDLEFLRTARTRSYKSIADLASAQASLFGQRHSAIAELNKIAEKKFSITSKLKEGQDSGSEGAATRAVQQIFSMGRKSLVMGDSPGDSGITEEEYQASLNGQDYEAPLPADPDSVINITRPVPDAVTDGDKFIEHENENVEYVLDIGEDGTRKDIYAINDAGEIIPDYPLPSDPSSLNFMINNLTGVAVDQLQRTYRVRRNGEDFVQSDDD